MKAVITTTAAASTLSEGSVVADWLELIKARLSGLVLLTTLCGYYLGSKNGFDVAGLMHTLLGTGLLASGASALNQVQERQFDARMRRTAHRPLPAGRMQPETALVFGVASAVAGLVHLAVFVNGLTCGIGALTLLIYNLVYTPLKRVTWLNTLVGAVPGALPPLMGWTAARGGFSAEGWMLFAILFLWQMPHFLAIAWLYREDYERGGFVMLPQVDSDGTRTGFQAVAYSAVLLAASLAPVAAGLVGGAALAAALVLGGVMLWTAVRFRRDLTTRAARGLFLASIAYLPLLLGAMALSKLSE